MTPDPDDERSGDGGGQLLYPVSDRGRRLSDAVRDALVRGGQGRWIAAQLSTGATDGQIYDRREDAIRHQLHETQCAYLVVPPGQMPPAEATAYLDLHDRMYTAGMRIPDSDDMLPVLPLAAPVRPLPHRWNGTFGRGGHRG